MLHGGVPLRIAILGCDLSFPGECRDDFGSCIEFTLAVGDGDGVQLTHFHARKPWGGVIRNPRMDVLRDMTGNIVVNESR